MARRLADPILQPEDARKILAELGRRQQREAAGRAEALLFGPQLAFATDLSPRIIACCSRRAGKSTAIGWRLGKAALKHPRSIVPYVARAREDARDIIWPAFQLLDDAMALGLQFKQNTGDVVFPNGSRVVLRGAGSRREIDKLRGPKYPEVAVDEAQGFGEDLEYLLDDVLEPATLDYHGAILLTGTPNAACAGPFHRMATGATPGWSVHGWTLRDNPHLRDVEAWLAALRKRRGWDEQHPTYLREYCGQWVRDSVGMVFRLDEALNVADVGEEPEDAEFCLGIDLGFDDPSAFVVVGYSELTGRTWVVATHLEAGLIPSAVAAKVEAMREQWPISRIVADSGGYGKGIVEEMRQKFRLPVESASKREKAAYVEMLNGDLRAGLLTIPPRERELLGEMRLLQWDLDSVEKGKPKYDRRFDDHLCDALLYAWRECRHHGEEREEMPPAPGSREFYARLEAELESEAAGDLGDDRPWWERLVGDSA